MSYNLFLDDIRMPYEVYNYRKPVEFRILYKGLDWIIVRNYEEFTQYILSNGLPEVVTFDHDLADIKYDVKTGKESFSYYEQTGYDCAKWMVEHCMENSLKLPKTMLCHSQNEVGKENIITYLRNAKKFI